MKFLFGKKSKKIEKLSIEVDKLNRELYLIQKENINDFIRILEQIQKTNKEPLHWKKRQSTITNETELAIQNYRNKLLELDINAVI